MTRAAVRAGIESYLLTGNLPFVGTIFPSRDYINETDYEQNANYYYTESINGSGCVIVINLPTDKRNRMTITGRGHVDDVDRNSVVLELFFASTAGEPQPAQADYDSIVDALIPLIRADPTFGDPSVFWSTGEFDAGVRHDQSDPFSDPEGATVHINGVVRFEALEWLAGTDI